MSTLEELFLGAAQRPLIVCDIDGTIAHYQYAATMAVNLVFGTSYLPEWGTWQGPFTHEQHEFMREMRKGDNAEAFFASIAPDSEGIHTLHRIADEGYSIVVCSDRPKKVRMATQAWLDRHGVPSDDIVLNGPGWKPKLAAQHTPENPAIFIDDNSALWLTLPRPGVEVWTVRRSYTPWTPLEGVAVFSSWTALFEGLMLRQDSGSFAVQ